MTLVGAKLVAQLLVADGESPLPLRRLVFHGNQIGPDGFSAVGEAIRHERCARPRSNWMLCILRCVLRCAEYAGCSAAFRAPSRALNAWRRTAVLAAPHSRPPRVGRPHGDAQVRP
eukprot:627404-Prymnesium_polylepis.1